jgi:formate/nitrite transporter FocA (FNT family)
VCLAIWLAYSARTTADRILAVVPPISAFVAAGFEHSVANMYFLPLANLLNAAAGSPMSVAWLWTNLVPVIAGNIVGGSVLVALVYYVIYRRPAKSSP